MTETSDTSVPRFAPGVRFRFDRVRDAWVVLAPERLFVPDEQAIEILKLVDGQRSLAAIIELLAARFEASRAEIAADVAEIFEQLRDRGAIRL